MTRLFLKGRITLPPGTSADHHFLADKLIHILGAEAVTPMPGALNVEIDRDVLVSYYGNVIRELESFVHSDVPAGAVFQLSENEEHFRVFGSTEAICADAMDEYARARIAKWRGFALASAEHKGDALRAEAIALLAEAEKADKMSPYIVTRVSASDVSNHVVWDRMRPDGCVAAKALGFSAGDGDRIFVSWALPVSELVGGELPDPPEDTDDEGDDDDSPDSFR